MTKQVQALRTALNQAFLERSTLIDGMLTALIAGDPLLFVGPPGTAKSAICHAITSAVSGQYFGWCLNKLTTPEELFGPISLKALENDHYLRMTDGKLPTANVAFLDEIFKTSSTICNSLLTIMNEKVYHNDGKAVPVPLRVLYAASNEVPQGEELGAMYDRFVLKYYVNYVKEDSSVDALFLGIDKVQMPALSLADVDTMQAIAKNPTKEDVMPVLPALKAIRHDIEEEGIQVSDRKWVQSVRILKAYSMLNEHAHIEVSDLEILENVLWSNIEQRSKVRKIVGKHSNPLGESILQYLDAASELFDQVNTGKVEAVEGFKKIQSAVKSLEKLGDPTKNSKLLAAITQVKGYQLRVATEKLGITT